MSAKTTYWTLKGHPLKEIDMSEKKTTEKVKVTYYLDRLKVEKLLDIYINRLKQNQRPLKSGIIEEGIQLLFKTEFENDKKSCVSKKRDEVAFDDRIKSTFSLDKETEDKIIDIYINRLRNNIRARKSEIIDEAINLIFNLEFDK